MSKPDLPLTPEDVAEIAAILDGTAYDRIDVTTARFRLRVAREHGGFTQDWTFGEDSAAPIAAPTTADPDAAAETGVTIRAPLPGTFYRAPAPGAAPFVETGAAVGPDTVVGIIETMKLMNPVHAGVHGVIGEILAENATMVAKGESLMRLADSAA
jgi:acetyl-CoA carboxylase biotin carboxyl carrier protein